MKCIIIFVTSIACAIAIQTLSFNRWQENNKITFSSAKEKVEREKIFEDHKREVTTHNSNPHTTYKKALNKFSHLTADEFIKTRCRTKLPDRLRMNELIKDYNFDIPTISEDIGAEDSTDIPNTEISENPQFRAAYPFGSYTQNNAPDSVNFSNYVLPIVDQGNCGGCWAFAVMAQLEGLLRIRNSSFNQHLSPQFLLDCVTILNSGCDGGWPTVAYYWLRSIHGGNNRSPTTAAYPYKATVGACNKSLSRISLGITHIKQFILGGNEASMKAHVANYGPIIAAVDGTNAMKSYSSGVFYDTTCSSGTTCTSMNHAVLIVGYGTDPLLGDYWLVKNSWGADWGENGFFRMARNKGNNCNIACYAMYAY